MPDLNPRAAALPLAEARDLMRKDFFSPAACQARIDEFSASLAAIYPNFKGLPTTSKRTLTSEEAAIVKLMEQEKQEKENAQIDTNTPSPS